MKWRNSKIPSTNRTPTRSRKSRWCAQRNLSLYSHAQHHQTRHHQLPCVIGQNRSSASNSAYSYQFLHSVVCRLPVVCHICAPGFTCHFSSKPAVKGSIPHKNMAPFPSAHLPFYGRWALTCNWINHWVCDAWPVQRQTYGYPKSRGASPTTLWPVPNYTAWWQRHMCVNNLLNLQSLGHQSDMLPLHNTTKPGVL